MLRQEFSGRLWSEAVDDVVNAIWDSGLLHGFRENRRADRSFFRGFHHYRVATGERRGDFPRQKNQRKIPRSDDSDYAERLADGIVQRGLAIRVSV